MINKFLLYCLCGLALVNLNANEELEKYKKLAEENPQEAQSFAKLGSLYTTMGKYAEAIENYQHALELEPQNQDIKAALANAYLFNQQLSQSQALFEDILESEPNNVDALMGLGHVKELSNKEEEAKQLYTQAALLDPHRKEIQAMLKRVSQKEKTDQEQALLSKASDLTPQEAILIYQELIQLNSQRADYYILLGQAYMRAEDKEHAFQALSEALKLEPKNSDAQIALAYLFFFEII